MSDDEYCPSWLKKTHTTSASAVEGLLLYEVGYYNALRRFQRVFERLKGNQIMKDETRQLFCSDIDYFARKHYVLLGHLLSNVKYDQEVVFDQCTRQNVDLGMTLVDDCFSPEYKRHVVSVFGSQKQRKTRYLELLQNAEFVSWVGQFDSEVSDATHTATFAELALESVVERTRRYPSMAKAIYDEYVCEKGVSAEATFQMKRVLLRANTLLDECYADVANKQRGSQVSSKATVSLPVSVARPLSVPSSVATVSDVSCRNCYLAIRQFQTAVGSLQQAAKEWAATQHRYAVLWQQFFGSGYGYDAYIHTTQKWGHQTSVFAAEAASISSCTRAAETICRHALRIGPGARATAIAVFGHRVVQLLFAMLIQALNVWWRQMLNGRVQTAGGGGESIVLKFTKAVALNNAAVAKHAAIGARWQRGPVA